MHSLHPIWVAILLTVLMMMLSCSGDIPAVEINPNATDGDIADGDGEDGEDGEDAEGADGDGIDGDTSDGDTTDGDYDNSYMHMDVPLADGSVRAGMIGGAVGSDPETEQLDGALAQGHEGDFKLYNSHVAFIISAVGPGRALGEFGGSILDAARLDENGKGNDVLIEAFPIAGVVPQFLPIDGAVRVLKAEEVTLIHNGSDGQPAIIRVSGIDWPLPMFDMIVDAADDSPLVPVNPDITLSVDYILEADADYLRIEMTAKIAGETDILNPESIRPGLAVLAPDNFDRFYPGMPIEGLPAPGDPLIFQNITPDHYAFLHPDASYAVAAASDDSIFALTVPVDPSLLMVGDDLVLNSPDPKSDGLIFMMGDGSAESLTRKVDDYRQGLTGVDTRQLLRVLGTVSMSAAQADQDVEVVAVKEIPNEDPEDLSPPEQQIWGSTFVDGTSFALSLPAGDWKLAAISSIGEWSDFVDIAIADGVATPENPILNLPQAAKITISVNERVDDAENPLQPVSARVDFYSGTHDYTNGVDIPDEAGRVATVFTNNSNGTATVRLPLNDQPSANFTYVISRGPEYTFVTGTDNYTAVLAPGSTQGPIGVVLQRIVGQTYQPEANILPGLENPDPATVHQITADLNVHAAPSMESRILRDERQSEAIAEDLDVIAATENDTIGSFGNLSGLSWIAGMEVSPYWSHITALNPTQPEDRPAYFGVPTLSYLEDGTYNGLLPTYGITEDLIASYNAPFIYIPHPRGESKGASFMTHFQYNPHEGYQEGFAYEAKETLAATDAFEVLNGRMDFIHSYSAIQDWLSLISEGVYVTAIGDADNFRRVQRNGSRLGSVRNQIYSTTSNPATADILSALMAGHNVVTTGPTIYASLYDALPGDTMTYTPDNPAATLWLPLNVRVEAPTWMPVDYVFACINGEPMDRYRLGVYSPNETGLAMERRWEFPAPRQNPDDLTSPPRDSYILIYAFSGPGKSLDPVYPKIPVFAVSNPIFLDLDGEPGFNPPPLREPGNPYCISAKLCELYTHYDGGRGIAAIPEACCQDSYSEETFYQTHCASVR